MLSTSQSRILSDGSRQRQRNANVCSYPQSRQAAFSLIFRVGIDNERIDRNPASHIRRQTENNARVRFLSEKEEAELRKVMLRGCPAQIPTLDLSLHTGMRTKEQFSLKWEQVDF